MPKTPRMKWTVPGEHLDPWYDSFVDLMADVDADAYASREDRNIIVSGGGTIGFNTGTGLLSWSAAIDLLAPTGFLWTIPAGSVTLNEGEAMYVELPRAPASNVSVTALVTSTLTSVTDQRALFALVFRRSNVLWWRSGSTVGVGAAPRLSIPLATGGSSGLNTDTTIGAFLLNPADYNYAPKSFFFTSLGSISTATFTGRISLFNVTTASLVASHDYTATATSRQRTTFTPPAGDNIYEIRIKTTTGTPPNDKIFAWWAGIEIEKV